MEATIETEIHPQLVANRYTLVVMAAKRAKQLKEGAPHLIKTESTNHLTIALEEIAAGKINYIAAPETEENEGKLNATAGLLTEDQLSLRKLTQSSGDSASSVDFDDDTDTDSNDEADIEADTENGAGSSVMEDE